MNNAIAFLVALWKTVRSNPVFVAISSAVGGTILDYLDDGFRSGHIDFSPAGFHKLYLVAVGAIIFALAHLYRPAPGANPN